jgi:hypothetical protein
VSHVLFACDLILRPLSDSIIFLTLTRLVLVLKLLNFRFALFTPPLGDFQLYYKIILSSCANLFEDYLMHLYVMVFLEQLMMFVLNSNVKVNWYTI